MSKIDMFCSRFWQITPPTLFLAIIMVTLSDHPIATLMGYVVFAVAAAECCVYLYWLLRRQHNN